LCIREYDDSIVIQVALAIAENSEVTTRQSRGCRWEGASTFTKVDTSVVSHNSGRHGTVTTGLLAEICRRAKPARPHPNS
jgi:hypothetical protein